MSGENAAISSAEFVSRFGGVYEHSPWVAEQCYEKAGGAARDELAVMFASCVDNSDRDARLALIRAHPDLAGRAAVQGDLTVESSEEQSSAGIDQCTPEEYEQFVSFNDSYKTKFGFPFIMAVRNSNRQKILAAFAERVHNDPETEFDTAIREIHKIARLRLEAMNDID
jgi:2-oxo-4-hydroxy-4-carboxy-5-ureidoimidazoline decarboxylase